MKIAYLSQSALSDVDFSFIKEVQKIMDITYYILVSPSQRQKAAVNFKSLPEKFGIFRATQFKELKPFEIIVDLEKVYVVNYTSTNNHQISKVVESYKVYKELKKKKYDVIHLTWPPSYMDWFIYRLRKRIVLTVHDPFPHSSQKHGIREYERKRAFRNIDSFILLNSAQRASFIQSYNLDSPTKHIYDSSLSVYDYLYIHKDSILPVNYNQVLFFGQIFAHKGVDYLLEAMVKVHKECPNAKLVVAGSGKYWFDIKPYENQGYIDIQNRYIPDVELVELVTTSAFVVVPYIDATQSGVIMTAYAFNRPCVATNVGALPESVKDGYNGIIVEPRDSSALAAAMVKLLQDPHMVDRFSNEIKKNYKEGGDSWLVIASQHKSIYQKICEQNKERKNEEK